MPAKRGADYLASLRDGRALYARGERVADVTAHPQFKRTAESLAGLFDLQRRSSYRTPRALLAPSRPRCSSATSKR